jgi:DNA polymerase-3 subunit epsilon
MLFGYGLPDGDGRPLPDIPFVVIDLETTGLTPEEDRVVEIAMARVENGRQVDEWATLIDPGRDPGPTFLHHISSAMLDGAPFFRDIAGEILSRLDGAIVVAHHAAFEESFLEAELVRLGVRPAPLPALCTLQLARAVLASPNYKLATCCEVAGIGLTDAHTALGDVRATALLLPRLLAMAPEIRYPVSLSPLPELRRRKGPRTRVTNLRKGTEGWISSLLSKLPYSMDDHDPVGAQPYVDALGEALAEGRLTREKTRRLGRLAGRAGMGAAQVIELHRRFLDGMRDAALVHDLVTADELRQLTATAELLDLPGYFADVTAHGVAEPKSGPAVWCGPSVPDDVRRRIEAAGYRLAVNISRGLAAAVVGYPDDASLKAQRAAGLGLKILRVTDVNAFLGAAALPAPIAPAGWYPDPTGRFVYRYWTGQGWTEHVSPGDGTVLSDAPTAHG